MSNTTIRLRRTATAGNVPNPNMLSNGEMILNFADGNLFFIAANSTVQRIGGQSPVSFGSVIAGGQSLVADTPTATLRFIAGQNITLTGISANDSIVIDATLSGGSGNVTGGSISNLRGLAVFSDTSGKNLIDSGIIFTSNSVETQLQVFTGTLDGNTGLCLNVVSALSGTNSKAFYITVAGTEKFVIDPQGNVRTRGSISVKGYADIQNTTITLPSSGNLRLHMGTTGGRRPRIASLSSLGRRIEYQEHLGDLNRFEIIPIVGVAVPTVIGTAASTVVGVNVLRTLSANNNLNSKKRTQYRSAGTAAAAAEIRNTSLFALRGNTSANGGFYYTTTIGVSEVPPSACAMAAFTLTNVTTAYAVTSNISQLRSFVGFGCDRSNTTLKWASSNNAGPANTIELGATFPVQNNAIYTMKMYAPPFSIDQNVYWSIERVDEPAYAEGVANPSFLPAGDQFLTYHHFMSNGIAAQNSAFDLISLYGETLM